MHVDTGEMSANIKSRSSQQDTSAPTSSTQGTHRFVPEKQAGAVQSTGGTAPQQRAHLSEMGEVDIAPLEASETQETQRLATFSVQEQGRSHMLPDSPDNGESAFVPGNLHRAARRESNRLEMGTRRTTPHASLASQDETVPVATAPTIQVTIGRIEVRATPPPAPRQKARPGPTVMSAEDYLHQRARGGQ